VRSENDYGPAAERTMQANALIISLSTLVVWDVYLLSADVIKVYRASDPSTRRSIGAAIWPKRNPLPQDGRCPSMIFLRKSEDAIYCLYMA
jgi:hypothetical protein